jgi:hypothetical protein
MREEEKTRVAPSYGAGISEESFLSYSKHLIVKQSRAPIVLWYRFS